LNEEQPLLVLRPAKKWLYSISISSLIWFLIINLSSILIISILKETVLQVNWFKLLDYIQDSHGIILFSVAFVAFLVMLLFLMFLVSGYLILMLFILITPSYLLFARKYIKYTFYPKMLIIERGIFIKTRKVYLYRSLTMVSYVQTFEERIFGIGTLVMQEPQLGVLIAGVKKYHLLELFQEYSNMLLSDKNRMMEASRFNNIRMKAIRGENSKERKNTDQLTPALKEMHAIMTQIFNHIV